MPFGERTTPQLEQLATTVVDAIFKVHSKTGPGLLESTYETCLVFGLRRRGLRVEPQKLLPIVYDGNVIDAGYRIDVLVEDAIIIELKAVDKMSPLYQAQLMTYLKLSGKTLGFLVNFNVQFIKDGIHRVVCG